MKTESLHRGWGRFVAVATVLVCLFSAPSSASAADFLAGAVSAFPDRWSVNDGGTSVTGADIGTGGYASVSGSDAAQRLSFDLDANQSLTYTPSQGSDAGGTADVVISNAVFSTAYEFPGVDEVGGLDSQAAICVYTNVANGGGLQYYGWAGAYTVDGIETNLTWFALTGATPAEGATNTVTMSFDYTASPATVTFKIGDTTLAPNPVQLVNNTKTQVSAVSFSGQGSISELAGESAPGAFEVSWYMDDGTTLIDKDEVAANGHPTHTNVAKNATAQYTYSFEGWAASANAAAADVLDLSAETVSAATSYYAVFTATPVSYTLTWNLDGGSITSEAGEYTAAGSVAYGTSLTAPQVAKTGYTFGGWSPSVDTTMPAANTTYTATWTINTYTITWKDGDGNTLDTDTVDYNETPSYAGETPTKAPTAQYTYAFNNTWSPTIVPATADAIYTAQFTETLRSYTITWKNGDTTLDTDTVAYGETPEYDGETPTKDADDQYTYTFAGWDPEISSVTGNATYTAQFDAHEIVYPTLALAKPTISSTVLADGVAGATVKVTVDPAAVVTAANANVAFSSEGAVTNATFTSLPWNDPVDWMLQSSGAEDLPGRFYAKGETDWFNVETNELVDIADLAEGMKGVEAEAPSAAGQMVRIQTCLEIGEGAMEELPVGNDVGEARTGFAVAQIADNGDTAPAFYAFNGTTWDKLSGATPGANTTNDLLIVLDVEASTARYYVEGIALYKDSAGARTYAIPMGASQTAEIHGIGFANPDGVLAPVVAEYDVPFEAAVGDTPYAAAADGLAAADKTGAQTLYLLTNDVVGTIDLAVGQSVKVDTAKGSFADGAGVVLAQSVPAGYVIGTSASGDVTTYTVDIVEYPIVWMLDLAGATNAVANALTNSYTVADLPITLFPAGCEGYTFDGWTNNFSAGATTNRIAPGTVGAVTNWATWHRNNVTLTVPAVAHATMAATTNGVALAGTTDGDNTLFSVVPGTAVDVVYTAETGYHVKDSDPVSTTRTYPITSGVMAHDFVLDASGTVMEINIYTVTFSWHDDSTSATYEHGTVATDIAVPRNPPDYVEDGKIYSFDHWSASVPETLTDDLTITAVYDEGVDAVATVFTVANNGATTNTVGTYASLAEAVGAATDGCTVLLLGDVTLDTRVDVNAGANTAITIDLGGNTVTRTGTSGNGSAFDVKSGDVTIKNGTIDCTQDDTDIAEDGVYAITSRSGSTVTLADLAITVDSECGACAYPFAGSTMTIESGTYANVTTTPYRYNTAITGMAVNQPNDSTQRLFIKGGSFSRYDPQLGDDSGAMTDFTDEGFVAIDDGNGHFVVQPGFNVAFDPNGGAPTSAAQRVAAGGKATAPDPAPTYAGRTFNGWTLGGNAFDFETVLTADIALVADWSINSYNVIWVANNAEYASNRVDYGTAMPVPATNPTKAADAEFTYAFEKWTPTPDGTVTSNATYTAVFTATKNQYNVIWVAEGATVSSNRLDYGATITAPAENPTKAGDDNALYTFVGWTPAQDATVSSNATYTAEFKTWTKVAVPTAATGLVYDGTEQTGVADGTGYTLTGNTGVDADDYTATAVIAADSVWADATEVNAAATADKTIAWSIARAAVTVTADDKSKVAGNADPELTATVSGTIGSDTVSYTVTRAAGETAGEYAITPSGEAEQGNYAVSYVAGTFTIGGAQAAVISVADAGTGACTTNYVATLAAAVAAARDGETVLLLENVTLDTRVEPNAGANTAITIDLGGNTVTRTGTSGNGSAFDVKSGDVTIKNGTIDCTQDDTAIAKDGVYAITSRSGSNVTLADLAITVDSECGACAYPFAGSTMTIESGTYANVTTTPYRYNTAITGMAVNQPNDSTQRLFIKGGSFSQYDPQLGDDSGAMTDFTDEGFVAIDDGNGHFVVQPGYNVTFDANGGSPVPAAQRVAAGGTATEPTGVTLANHSLRAWRLNGADYDFDTVLSADIELVADWAIDQFDVIWVADNAQFASNRVDYGEPTPVPQTNPTKGADAEFSYEFASWTPTPDATVTSNATYTAVFTPVRNQYNVIWVADGAQFASNRLDYGAAIVAPAETPTKAGDAQYTYAFASWTPAPDGTVTSNATYTAVFTETLNTYTVTWKNYNGDVLATYTDVPYGTTTNYVGATPVRPADAQYTYDFTGWDPVVGAIAGDTTYIAQFAPIGSKVMVIHVAAGGATTNETYYSDLATAIAAAADGDTVKLLDDVTVDARILVTESMTIDLGGHTITRTAAPASDNGSVFRVDGDYDVTIRNGTIDCSGVDDSSVAEDGVYAIDVKNGGDLTLSELAITVNSECGACVYPWAGSHVTIESGTYANTTTTPYRHHAGWQGMAVNQANVADKLLTINGGSFSQMDPQIGDDSTTGTDAASADFTGEGYVAILENGSYVVQQGYNVTFDANGGSPEPEAQRVAAGGTATEPTGVTLANHSLRAWQTNGVDWVFTDAVASDMTLVADWSIDKFDVIWVADGSQFASNRLDYGADITAPAENPTRPATAQFSYEFAGWTPAPEGTVTSNATYTAVFTATTNKYDVIWVADGATVSSNRLDYGATITAPAENPTKAGNENALYTFVGWTPAQDATVSSNATYVAEFKTWAKVAVPTAATGLVYDGTTQTGVATGDGYTLANNTGANASNYVATAMLADAANTVWADATEVNAAATADRTVNWSIAKAPATITVDNAAKKHGEADPAFIGKVEGLFAAGDLGEVSYGRTNDTEAVGVYAGVIVPTYTANANYDVTVTPGTFTIENNEITIIWVVDGSETTNKVEWGDMPVFAGATNKTDATGKYAYAFTGWTPEVTNATVQATYTAGFTPSVATPLALPLADPKLASTAVNGSTATVALDPSGVIDGVSFSASPETATWDAGAGALSFSDLEWNQGITWSVSAEQGEAALAETASNAGKFYAKPEAPWFTADADDLVPLSDMGDAAVGYTNANPSAEGEMVRVHTTVEIPAGGLPQAPEVGSAKSGFAVLQLEGDSAPAFYAYNGTGWVKLSGVEPVEGEADYYAVYDLGAETPTARYYIDGLPLYLAVDGGDDVYAIPLAAGTTSLATIAFASADMVKGDIVAEQDVSYAAAVGQTPYTNIVDAVAAQGKDPAKTLALLKDGVALDPAVSLGTTAEKLVVDYAKGSFTNEAPVVSGVAGYRVAETAGEGAVTNYALAAIVYPIEYVLDGGENAAANTNEYTVETLPVALADASRIGYSFAGWTNNVAAGVQTSIPVGTLGAVTNVATWSINKYLLTVNYLYATGGVASAQFTSNVVYDTAYSVDSPVVTGYTPSVATVSGTMAAEPVAVDVTYTANRYRVKFVDEDGTTVLKDETEYDYGTPAADIEKPEDPTKAATDEKVYAFAGWSPEVADVTGDATYTATYSETATKVTVFTVADNGDGTATTNTVGYYADLATAVANAADGSTVLLLDDVALDARIDVDAGADTSITIDLGGNTITRTGTSGNGSAFDVKSGDVTIRNGEIDCTQDDTAIAENGVYAITSRSGSNVTLADLDITVDSECGACAYPFAGSHMTIESGTYANVTTTPYRYKTAWTGMAVNQANVDDTLITITGGTFSQVNPMLGDDSAAAGTMSFVDPDYFAVSEGGVFTVVPRIDIALATVAVAEDLVYDATGKAGVTSVDYGTTNLVEGTDFTVAYANNTNATTEASLASATLTGVGLWTGSIVTNFPIAKAEATFTAASATKVYDGTALATNDFSVVGLVSGHTATATVAGSQTDVGASSNVVSAATIVDGQSQDVTANYAIAYVDGELTVTPAAMAITIAGVDATSVYTGAEQTTNVAWTATSETAGFVATNVSYAGAATVSGTDVGDYLYNLDVTKFSYADNNYAATFTLEGDGKFTITPAAITITVAGYTGIYDGAAHAASATTVPSGATVTWSVDGGEFTDTVPSVTGVTNVTVVAKAAMANYTDATATTSLVVTAAVVDIPAAPGNKTYNGVAQTADVASADTYTVTNEGGTNAGDYTVEFALNDTANYTWSDGSITNQVFGWSITKAAATITVDNASKKHGEADPAFTGTVVGLFADGDLGAVTYGRTNDTEAVGVYAGVIVPAYTANDNYDVTVAPGTFTIENNEITIIWVVDGSETTNKVEWGDMPAFAGSTDKAADSKYAYAFTGWTPAVTNATVQAVYTAGYATTIATPLALAVADEKLASTAVDSLAKTATVAADLIGAVEGVTVAEASGATVTIDEDTATASFSGLAWNQGVEWTMTAQQTAADDAATAESATLPGKFYVKPETAWFTATTNQLEAVADTSDAAVAYTNAVASNEGEMVRVHTKIAVPAGGLPAAPQTGSSKVGFAVLQLEDDTAPAYYAFGNGAWTKLAGAEPTEGDHDYLAVYDLAAETPTARYYIDGVALYSPVDGGDDVYALPLAAGTTSLKSISFASKEMVRDDIVAEQDVSYVAAVDTTPYTAIGEALAAAGTAGEKTLELLKTGVALDPAVSLGSGEKLVVDYATGAFTNETPVVSGVAGYDVKVTEAETVKTYELDPIVYPIEYVLNGGDNDASNTNEYTVAILPLALADATRTGYRFDGWTNNVSDNAVVTSIPVGTIGAVTNVATWTINSYALTVNYLYTNGTAAATQFTSNVVYDTAYSVDSPVIAGFTADKPTVSGTMGAAAVTVDVTYTIDRYTVEFLDEDGSVLLAATGYDYGTLAADIAKPETPTKAATAEKVYTFAGWTPAVETVTSNAVYTASYAEADTKAAVISVADNGDGTATTNTTYVASIADAIGLAGDGDIVQLLANVSEPAVAIEDDITIDLNGNTWTVTPAEGESTPGTIAVSGDVTIVDGGENGGGSIASAAATAIAVSEDGALTVAGGTVAGAVSATGGDVTVSGGTVDGAITASGETSQVSVSGGSAGAITVSGGADVAVTGGQTVSVTATGPGATVDVSGGTVTGDVRAMNGAAAAISGTADVYRVQAAGNGSSAVVTGGHFTKDPSVYVADGFVAVAGDPDGFDVIQRVSLEGAVLTVAENLVYTGIPQSNIVAVVVDGTTLEAGTDYTVAYEDNVNATTPEALATATIAGIGVWSGQIVTNFAIGKATLVATADDKAVDFGDDPAGIEFTVTVTGFVNGETTNVLAAVPTAACASYTARTVPGVYAGAIEAVGGEAANYAFEYAAGTLTVAGDPQLVKPGDLFTAADLESGVRPVEVVTDENGDTFVVRFRRAQPCVVYELVASTSLETSGAQWRGEAESGNAVVVDTDETTTEPGEMVELSVDMSAAYPARFFKIRASFPSSEQP